MGQGLKPPWLRLAVTNDTGSYAKKRGPCHWKCGCNKQQQYVQLITKP